MQLSERSITAALQQPDHLVAWVQPNDADKEPFWAVTLPIVNLDHKTMLVCVYECGEDRVRITDGGATFRYRADRRHDEGSLRLHELLDSLGVYTNSREALCLDCELSMSEEMGAAELCIALAKFARAVVIAETLCYG